MYTEKVSIVYLMENSPYSTNIINAKDCKGILISVCYPSQKLQNFKRQNNR